MGSMRLLAALCLLCTDFAGARAPSDSIVGTMKGLVDGYVAKYDTEVANFKTTSDAMTQVIKNAADAQAKSRAVDEKAKLKKEHEATLKDLAGFVRTLDDTVKALRPGQDTDWKEQFPDLKTKVD